jgi:acyl carrier protein
MTQNIRQVLAKILVEELKLPIDPATISDDQSIEDLGMNSLHLMKLIYLLEDTFDIRLDTDEILDVDGVRDLLSLLEAKIGVC